MEFNVTQKDIDEGTPQNSKDCAIARALMRTMDVVEVCVGTKISFPYNSQDAYTNSPKIMEFIFNFHRDRKLVAPCTIVLDEKTMVAEMVGCGV